MYSVLMTMLNCICLSHSLPLLTYVWILYIWVQVS